MTSMQVMKQVTMYTDGSCRGNPGPGGYGVVLKFGRNRHELSGSFRQTTNNRMERMAPIQGLEMLKESCKVAEFSDSKYVVDGIEKGWASGWRANGWRRNKRQRAENVDLWKRLLDLCEQHEVKFHWLRGHDGDPENERCDEMAVAATFDQNLPVDSGYEASQVRSLA